MPSLESATHYPGTVIFEATNLSVGRGTPIAFQVVGAPWLDALAVVSLVGALPGADIRDTTITPEAPPDGKYDGEVLHAVKLAVTDRSIYDPVLAAIAILSAVWQQHGEMLSVRERALAMRIGTDEVWRAVVAGEPPVRIAAGWNAGLARFRGERERYLLYR
jgi:uncharacterized protein YbbC (DUF1343 family)